MASKDVKRILMELMHQYDIDQNAFSITQFEKLRHSLEAFSGPFDNFRYILASNGYVDDLRQNLIY